MGVFQSIWILWGYNWLPFGIYLPFFWIWVGDGNMLCLEVRRCKEFIGVFSAGIYFLWDMESFIFCYFRILNLLFLYVFGIFPLLLSVTLITLPCSLVYVGFSSISSRHCVAGYNVIDQFCLIIYW